MKMNLIIVICFFWTMQSCTSESNDQSAKTEITSDHSYQKDTKPVDDSLNKRRPEPKVNDKPEDFESEKSKKIEPPPVKPKKPEATSKKNAQSDNILPDVKKNEPGPSTKKTTKYKTKKTETKEVKPPPPPIEKAKIFFPDTLHDFGFINEGDTITHSFRFINDGKAPLEILDVQVSCGCTVPLYSLAEILPGRLSKIDVTYLSKGKIGSQIATIDVLTNAENPSQTLYLKGVIR